MARRPADAKTRSLKEHGCLNPHAETVRDELFLSNAFFDPRDLVQVRYEMLRRVREDGVPVSHAAASFGVSRPTWYQAQRAYEADGLPGLLPDRPGPRRPHKLSDEVVEALQAAKSEQPELTAADLVELVRTRFGISVHRRSIDRALAREKNDDDAQPALRRARRGGAFRLSDETVYRWHKAGLLRGHAYNDRPGYLFEIPDPPPTKQPGRSPKQGRSPDLVGQRSIEAQYET